MGRYRSAFVLPFPSEWDIDTFDSPRYAFWPGLVGLIPVLGLVGAVFDVLSGGAEPVAYGMIAGCAVFAALIYTVVWQLSPGWADVRAETVVRDGEAALAIPLRLPSRTPAIVSGVLGVLLIIGGVVILVRAFGSDPSGGFLWFAGMAGVGALLVFIAFAGSTPVRETAELLLTPDHLRIDDGAEIITLAWDDISAIRALHVEKNSGTAFPVPGANLLDIVVDDPEVLQGDAVPIDDESLGAGYLAYEFAHRQFASDPLLTFHALTFYWERPGLRHELGTDAARERFHDGRYRTADPESDYDR